jgi:hypothetical protein
MAQFSCQNLWEEALETLAEEEKSKYQGLVSKGSGHITILDDILLATTEKKEQCIEKRWKISIRGRIVVLSDVLAKLAIWINKFVAVGDNAVQYDPGHAALPWAAIRFILKASVNEVEIFGAVLQSVESISRTLTRCTVMENLYLSRCVYLHPAFADMSSEISFTKYMTATSRSRTSYAVPLSACMLQF